jgi:hypothetical protein
MTMSASRRVRLKTRGKSDDLHLQPRVVGADRRHHLRQQVIGAAIRRADADLALNALPRPRQRIAGARHLGLDRLGMGQQPPALIGQLVTLRRAGEEPHPPSACSSRATRRPTVAASSFRTRPAR